MSADELTWCVRLKSKRRKIRLSKKHQEKKWIALDKERKRLCEQIRNLGYEPLVPPVQKGWQRSFVLRDDIKRDPRAAFFESLLAKVNTVQHSDSRKFLVKHKVKGKTAWLNRTQKLKTIGYCEWTKLKLTEKEKIYFSYSYVRLDNGEWRYTYVFNDPWRFVLNVKPYMLYWLQIKDAVLEQKLAQIRNSITNNNLEGKIRRLRGRAKFACLHELKYEDPFRDKPFHALLEEYYETKFNNKYDSKDEQE